MFVLTCVQYGDGVWITTVQQSGGSDFNCLSGVQRGDGLGGMAPVESLLCSGGNGRWKCLPGCVDVCELFFVQPWSLSAGPSDLLLSCCHTSGSFQVNSGKRTAADVVKGWPSGSVIAAVLSRSGSQCFVSTWDPLICVWPESWRLPPSPHFLHLLSEADDHSYFYWNQWSFFCFLIYYLHCMVNH